MKNTLEKFAEQLKPLNDTIKNLRADHPDYGYNEYWQARYFNYDPTGFRISSLGGGCYFNVSEEGGGQQGYIPVLDIQTQEEHAYTLLELNHENAQRLYTEHPNVYLWLEYLMGLKKQENFNGILQETVKGKVVLGFNTRASSLLGISEYGCLLYDQRLTTVVAVKDGDNGLGEGAVWNAITENTAEYVFIEL